MSIGVFSVIYPLALPYLKEFLNSLASQTYKDFTLFLVNDGVAGIDEMVHQVNLNVISKDIRGTPSAIRKAGIAWTLSHSIDTIIFADTDDYFMDNRIAVSQDSLVDSDIIFNELIIIGENVQRPFSMLGERFQEGEEISYENLKDSNCMGFSNTAIKTKNVPKTIFQIPDDMIAFDWAFFSLCFREELKAVFTKKTATYYRQHENNIASPSSLTPEQILRGVQVKRDHYQFMSQFDNNSKAEDFGELFDKLSKDILLRDHYCQRVINQSSSIPLWWESVKLLRELGL